MYTHIASLWYIFLRLSAQQDQTITAKFIFYSHPASVDKLFTSFLVEGSKLRFSFSLNVCSLRHKIHWSFQNLCILSPHFLISSEQFYWKKGDLLYTGFMFLSPPINANYISLSITTQCHSLLHWTQPSKFQVQFSKSSRWGQWTSARGSLTHKLSKDVSELPMILQFHSYGKDHWGSSKSQIWSLITTKITRSHPF